MVFKTRVGVNDEHEPKTIVFLGARKSLVEPGQIGGVAPLALLLQFGRALEVVVAAEDVHGGKGNAAKIPHLILDIFRMLGIRSLAVEGNGALPQATALRSEEHTSE